MVFREYELTGHVTGADTPEILRDRIDLKKWEVNQAAEHFIRAHKAVQRTSSRRQLRAFMSEHGSAMATALAPGADAPQRTAGEGQGEGVRPRGR